MEALTISAILPSRYNIPNSPVLRAANFFSKPCSSNLRSKPNSSKFKPFSSSPVSLDHRRNHAPLELEHFDDGIASAEENTKKFDWYSQWYPLMPECDLDKRVPHAKKVMGIDVVVWWDENESAWKVFDDMCPHRLAPLSEGRIDGNGRLQCVYHGWCFDGSGSCTLIPQAPVEGPPVHNNKRACVAAYPTVLQYGIVWFWPNSDPQYKDIFEKKKPPFVPELDDPSFTKVLGSRDLPYGYEILIENLLDPAHIPYSHRGLVPLAPPIEKRDREGGRPLEYRLKEESIDGFDAELEYGRSQFIAPCIATIPGHVGAGPEKQSRRTTFVFMCVPVSPGKSRLIWAFPRNFDKWVDKVVPRWFVHLNHNTVLDSDLNLLHVEEQRIKEAGGNRNWHKACFVPTKSDALVVGFRKWLNQYGGGEVDWGGKYGSTSTPADLPPTPPREQLMDRYWTHVVNCSSCSRAYKRMKALETFLLALSVGSIAIAAAAATKESITMLAMSRTRFAIMAMICFAASRWLARFVDTNFRYHDYNHSFPPSTPFCRVSKLIGVGL